MNDGNGSYNGQKLEYGAFGRKREDWIHIATNGWDNVDGSMERCSELRFASGWVEVFDESTMPIFWDLVGR